MHCPNPGTLPILYMDGAGYPCYANQAIREMFGFQLQQLFDGSFCLPAIDAQAITALHIPQPLDYIEAPNDAYGLLWNPHYPHPWMLLQIVSQPTILYTSLYLNDVPCGALFEEAFIEDISTLVDAAPYTGCTQIDLARRLADDSIISTNWHLIPIRNPHNIMTHALLVAPQPANQQVQTTHFMSDMIYQLRAPLAVIHTSAEILSRYADRLSIERVEHHLEMIQQEVQSADDVLKDLTKTIGATMTSHEAELLLKGDQ